MQGAKYEEWGHEHQFEVKGELEEVWIEIRREGINHIKTSKINKQTGPKTWVKTQRNNETQIIRKSLPSKKKKWWIMVINSGTNWSFKTEVKRENGNVNKKDGAEYPIERIYKTFLSKACFY